MHHTTTKVFFAVLYSITDIISSVCRAGLIISVMIRSLWQCLYSHILCCHLCSLYTCHGWLNFPFIFSWVIVRAWVSGHTWQCRYCSNLRCILFTTAWTRVIKLCVLCGIVNSRGIFGVSWENNNWKTCIRSIWIQLQSSDTLLLCHCQWCCKWHLTGPEAVILLLCSLIAGMCVCPFDRILRLSSWFEFSKYWVDLLQPV